MGLPYGLRSSALHYVTILLLLDIQAPSLIAWALLAISQSLTQRSVIISQVSKWVSELSERASG